MFAQRFFLSSVIACFVHEETTKEAYETECVFRRRRTHAYGERARARTAESRPESAGDRSLARSCPLYENILDGRPRVIFMRTGGIRAYVRYSMCKTKSFVYPRRWFVEECHLRGCSWIMSRPQARLAGANDVATIGWATSRPVQAPAIRQLSLLNLLLLLFFLQILLLFENK